MRSPIRVTSTPAIGEPSSSTMVPRTDCASVREGMATQTSTSTIETNRHGPPEDPWNRDIDAPILEEHFPGRPVLAHMTLDAQEAKTIDVINPDLTLIGIKTIHAMNHG